MNTRSNGHDVPEFLISRARAGDRSALGSLLEQYRNYLSLLARSQLGATLQALMHPSDLVQETFLEAQRDFRNFKGSSEGEILTWLRRILARNLADQVKRNQAARRDSRRMESLEALLERSGQAMHEVLAAGITSPSEQASRREQAVLLADALSSLPADYREVIVLRHIDRLKFEEIAARMGRSPGAVRKLWTRALIRLRSLLEESP